MSEYFWPSISSLHQSTRNHNPFCRCLFRYCATWTLMLKICQNLNKSEAPQQVRRRGLHWWMWINFLSLVHCGYLSQIQALGTSICAQRICCLRLERRKSDVCITCANTSRGKKSDKRRNCLHLFGYPYPVAPVYSNSQPVWPLLVQSLCYIYGKAQNSPKFE